MFKRIYKLYYLHPDKKTWIYHDTYHNGSKNAQFCLRERKRLFPGHKWKLVVFAPVKEYK